MAITSGSPIIDLPGAGGGGYNPSAPTGGPATNMAGSSPYFGQVAETGIFVGWDKVAGRPSDPHEGKLFGDAYKTEKSPVLLTRTQLLSAFDQFDRKDYLRFRNLFIAAGLAPETAEAMDVRDAYDALIAEVENMQAGGIQMSPMQLIKTLIRKNGLDPKKIGAGEDYGQASEAALPQSQTTTTVYDLSPEDARLTLEQAMTQKLGRAPTPEEIEDFIAAAQTRAERNPTQVTQEFRPGVAGGSGDEVSVQREGGEVVGTTVTNVDEGFDADSMTAMADRRAQNAPDYASYQSVSQYFPALVQALGATV